MKLHLRVSLATVLGLLFLALPAAAQPGRKPNIVINMDGDGGGVLAAGFIGAGQGPLALCIAGPRESEAPGIYAKTRAFLGGVLEG